MTSFYSFSMPDAHGNDIPFSNYQGKVVLLFNSATHCGLTGQYKEIQELYDRYHDQGLEVLDFPCNQFKNQAPGSIDDIATFCESKFGTTFKLFDKVDVNGPNAAPLFTFLKETLPKDQDSNFLFSTIMNVVALTGGVTHDEDADIAWNFTKFLIDRNGKVVNRFAPTVKPAKLSERIAALLAEPTPAQ